MSPLIQAAAGSITSWLNCTALTSTRLCPKKGVWNFHLLRLESSRHLFLGKAPARKGKLSGQANTVLHPAGFGCSIMTQDFPPGPCSSSCELTAHQLWPRYKRPIASCLSPALHRAAFHACNSSYVGFRQGRASPYLRDIRPNGECILSAQTIIRAVLAHRLLLLLVSENCYPAGFGQGGCHELLENFGSVCCVHLALARQGRPASILQGSSPVRQG